MAGWLKKLFGTKEETQEAEEPEDQALPEEAAPVTPEQPQQQTGGDEDEYLTIDGGAMLRVWRFWKHNLSTPDPICLTGRDHRKDLPLTGGDQAMAREKLRLKTQLEKDARERMRVIEARTKNEDMNAEVHVYLSRYGMVAWIFIFPPVGESGKLKIEDVGKALQKSGVTAGVDSNIIVQLTQKDFYYELIPIACGVPPVEGSDGKVEELYPRQFEQTIKIDEDGVADYRSLTYVQLIEKGKTICNIIPPVEGEAGLRVDGKVVEPKRVRPAKIPAGSNTELSEDGAHLLAAIDGHLVFSGDVFMVRPLLEVKGDVDYSTGNIDFRGDVHVHGDVRENFFVRATGTITVDGTVEAANIDAGGDLIVSSGVLGDNRATIKSGGCVRVKYLESCVAYAGKGVFADCIMAANVYSDDSVSVTTGRGAIIGGNIVAARKITANIIGSQSGMKTSLTLGLLPYTQEKNRTIADDIKTIRQEMKELNKTLEYLESQQGMSAGVDEKFAKARLRKSVLTMKENKLVRARDEQQNAAPDLSSCRVECGVIYPITSVKIHDDMWKADKVRKACTLTYDKELASIREV